jgi:hypothetical protein
LLTELNSVAGQLEGTIVDIIIVDDGSRLHWSSEMVPVTPLQHLNRISVTKLGCNLGHQRAIAAGLYTAVERKLYETIIIMDCDGEDLPQDVARLLAEQRSHPDSIVAAERAHRSEGPAFKAFYGIYKTLYRTLTGSEISFGNFSAISANAASRLLHMPELWNNFPSALLRSRLPLRTIETNRGKRFFGDSKMNFSSLVIHGLSAISVNSEIVFARIMLLCFVLALVTATGGVTVAGIRVFTDLAIPGWASDVIGSLAIIFTQIVFFFFTSMFLLLHARSNPASSPRQVIPGYISTSHDIQGNDQTGI